MRLGANDIILYWQGHKEVTFHADIELCKSFSTYMETLPLIEFATTKQNKELDQKALWEGFKKLVRFIASNHSGELTPGSYFTGCAKNGEMKYMFTVCDDIGIKALGYDTLNPPRFKLSKTSSLECVQCLLPPDESQFLI